MARQLAGVNVGDGHRAVVLQIAAQVLGAAKVRGHERQIFDHQASGVDRAGFNVFRVGAVAADMRIGEGDDLLTVAWVGQDFLVTRHGGVENDLANSAAAGANRDSGENRTVSERQNGLGVGSLERQKHGVLRVVYGYAQAPRNSSWRLMLVGIGALKALGKAEFWKAPHCNPAP